jgi:hypothetical protein
VALQLPEVARPYQLNPAELTRCAVCGVSRHTDPTVTRSMKLAPYSPVPQWNSQNLAMIEPSRRHGHVDTRLRINGPRPAPWRGIHQSPHRRIVLGGLAFCLLSLGASVLVARHLSDANWPLDDAHVPLVFLAGCSYLAGFGFRALGWHQLFPSRERPDGARCLAACGAAAASGVVLPFRLDLVVKISTLRRLGGVTLGIETIAVSILALGMVDAVAIAPLAATALALSGPVLRAPLIVVVLFCVGSLGILTLGQRVDRLPLVGRSDRLHTLYRRVADSTRFSRPTLVAGLLLMGCWTSRAVGSTLLLSALGAPFSPTLALVVLCMGRVTSILPITIGGAVAGMATTAGVLLALGVSKGVAVNFSLASGLMLTTAAVAAAALGLAGSLLLSFRGRRLFAAAMPASGFVAPATVKRFKDAPDYAFVTTGGQR